MPLLYDEFVVCVRCGECDDEYDELRPSLRSSVWLCSDILSPLQPFIIPMWWLDDDGVIELIRIVDPFRLGPFDDESPCSSSIFWLLCEINEKKVHAIYTLDTILLFLLLLIFIYGIQRQFHSLRFWFWYQIFKRCPISAKDGRLTPCSCQHSTISE